MTGAALTNFRDGAVEAAAVEVGEEDGTGTACVIAWVTAALGAATTGSVVVTSSIITLEAGLVTAGTEAGGNSTMAGLGLLVDLIITGSSSSSTS
jgi:hypothetical protein